MSIKPELAGGFNDYLPEEASIRNRMIESITKSFELFGFVPLETPGIEREATLTGGDLGFTKEIFRIKMGSNEEPLALRFDLTVPLARVIAANPNLTKPFKRYQIGKVWRAEKPQAGRFREFYQFDADIVGSARMSADAEIVALIHRVMTGLGFEDFTIRINNRKILNGLADFVGFSETKTPSVLRIIDKLDRVGWEGVADQLTRPPDNSYDESAVGLDRNQLAKIKVFLDLQNESNSLEELAHVMRDSSIAQTGIKELNEIRTYLVEMIPEKYWSFDLSVARGLGYYTGPVFETVLTANDDLRGLGSVFSGGRYDDLVSRFGNIVMPATGASVGFDRIFIAIKQLNLLGTNKNNQPVVILNFDEDSSVWLHKVATLLRNNGIPTDIYQGNSSGLRAQLPYALKSGALYVIIAGKTERDRNTVQIKDLASRTQVEVSLPEIINFFKGK